MNDRTRFSVGRLFALLALLNVGVFGFGALDLRAGGGGGEHCDPEVDECRCFVDGEGWCTDWPDITHKECSMDADCLDT